MIVGEGAAPFAAERGAKKIGQLPERVVAEHREWLEKRIPSEVLANWPNVPLAKYTWPKPDPKGEKDTVVYLVRNARGQIAGGTSTAGWEYKYPGRLGDSPIISAGLYADS
jgi:L-asparaginase